MNVPDDSQEMVDINKRISLVEKMTKYLGIVVAIQAMEAFCTSIAFFKDNFLIINYRYSCSRFIDFKIVFENTVYFRFYFG